MNYLAEYRKNLRVRNYSQHTIAHYISDLKLFEKFTGKPWQDIQKEDVANFVRGQVKRKFSPKTINRRLSAIKRFFEYLREELELQIKNPVRSSQFLRSGRRLPRTLDNEDIEKFLDVITDVRDRAIFSLMLRCGLRVSEVAELKLENVNLFRRELRIIGKRRKERIIPIPHKLFELLFECLKIRPNNPNFFWNKKQPSQPLKINSIQWLIRRYAKTARIDVRCHSLRHCFARQMTENGVERTVLRDLMGHTNISSTDVYGKLSDPFVKESYFKAMEKILSDNR